MFSRLGLLASVLKFSPRAAASPGRPTSSRLAKGGSADGARGSGALPPSGRIRRQTAAFGLLALGATFGAACAPDSDDVDESTGALATTSDEHWFYTGPLPALERAAITVSLAGNTARVSGILPAGTDEHEIRQLPNVRLRSEGERTRIDVVYPIATAAPPKTNSKPGTYSFYVAKPFRPDGNAWTKSQGNHWVPWGGFPFVAYNDGIAFHGPITSQENKSQTGTNVWYLRRGDVSGGCNRMMGEHVVELSHIIGVNMRNVYSPNQEIEDPSKAKVTVIADYDSYEGKYIDVDYPTDEGVTRPGVALGDDKVTMFGSWVSSLAPDGSDLPPDEKWEGGVRGKLYVFAQHAQPGMVCSFPQDLLSGLKKLQTRMGSELPRSICEKKTCIARAVRSGDDPKSRCGL